MNFRRFSKLLRISIRIDLELTKMMFDDDYVMKLQDLLFVEVKISNYEHLNQTVKAFKIIKKQKQNKNKMSIISVHPYYQIISFLLV